MYIFFHDRINLKVKNQSNKLKKKNICIYTYIRSLFSLTSCVAIELHGLDTQSYKHNEHQVYGSM